MRAACLDLRARHPARADQELRRLQSEHSADGQKGEKGTCPSDGRRRQWDPIDFPVTLIPDRDEIAFSDHARLFGTDPMGDETSMIHGFHVIPTFVAKQVMSRNLTGQMKKILRHHSAFATVQAARAR